MKQRGFLLIEALIAISILSIAAVVFLGLIGKALRIAANGRDLQAALSADEELLFDLNAGLRADLTAYGGKGRSETGANYEITPLTSRASYADLEVKSVLPLRLIVSESGVSQ